MNRWLIPFMIGFPLGGLIVLGTIGLIYYAGPQLESRFGPTIIRASHVAGSITRAQKELCWDTRFDKYNPRPPLLFSYRITYQGYEIPVSTYRIEEDGRKVPLSQAGFSHHNAGEEWISRYCLEIPEMLPPNSTFTVEGVGYYNSLTKLWRVPIELPSFVVEASKFSFWVPGRRRFARRNLSPSSVVLHEPLGLSSASLLLTVVGHGGN